MRGGEKRKTKGMLLSVMSCVDVRAHPRRRGSRGMLFPRVEARNDFELPEKQQASAYNFPVNPPHIRSADLKLLLFCSLSIKNRNTYEVVQYIASPIRTFLTRAQKLGFL